MKLAHWQRQEDGFTYVKHQGATRSFGEIPKQREPNMERETAEMTQHLKDVDAGVVLTGFRNRT